MMPTLTSTSLSYRSSLHPHALPFLLQPINVQESDQPPTIEEKTEGMTHMEGYFDLYWDEHTGKMYVEIDKWDVEFLYAVSLAAGLGSNPVGLDRGQLGDDMILKAHRVGPKVLLIQPNYRYRALSDDSAKVATVEDAFAASTHWGFEVEAETGERVLVDGTDFFMRDAHNVIRYEDLRTCRVAGDAGKNTSSAARSGRHKAVAEPAGGNHRTYRGS